MALTVKETNSWAPNTVVLSGVGGVEKMCSTRVLRIEY